MRVSTHCGNVIFLEMQNSSPIWKSVTSCESAEFLQKKKIKILILLNNIYKVKIWFFKLRIGHNLKKICDLRSFKQWLCWKQIWIGFLLVLGQKWKNGKISLSDQCFPLISHGKGTNGFAMLLKVCKSMALIQWSKRTIPWANL